MYRRNKKGNNKKLDKARQRGEAKRIRNKDFLRPEASEKALSGY